MGSKESNQSKQKKGTAHILCNNTFYKIVSEINKIVIMVNSVVPDEMAHMSHAPNQDLNSI